MCLVYGILIKRLAALFPWFSSDPPGKYHDITSGRPWPLPSKFIIHQSSYHSVLYGLDTESELCVLIVGALEIDEVRASDQGSYRCNASSLDRHRLSTAAALIIDMNLGELVRHFTKCRSSDLSKLNLFGQCQIIFPIQKWANKR
jgi:hypothetical protein